MQSAGLSREQVIEKAVSFAFAGAVVAFLPTKWIALLFILMGQGHFMCAYLYQFKAGKIGWRYLAAWIVVAALVGYGASLLRDPRIVPVVASVYFIHHFWVDERHLLGNAPKPALFLESLPFVAMYIACVFDSGRYFDLRVPAAVAGATLLLALFIRDRVLKVRFTSTKLYFLLLNAGALACCLSGKHISMERLMGFLILAHYSNWYLNYFFRLTGKKNVLAGYVRNVFIVNAVVVAAFLLMTQGPDSMRTLGVVFSRNAFYLWAIIHILFTTRPTDFAYWGLTFARPSS